MNLIDIIGNQLHSGKMSNEEAIEIIKLCGNYLNLQTIPNYAKNKKMTYNGVKNHRCIIDFFGAKMVVDND